MAINKNINKRGLPGYDVQDQGALANLKYNDAAGSEKVSEVGRHLLPIPNSATTWTTNVTAATPLARMGKNLAVYNNSGTVASITLGEDNTITSLAAGVTDSSGHVGIALMPNAWTYVACGKQNWVIASASTVLVYLIDDDTSIKFQAVPTT
jgi:hypothetical protein